MSFAPSCGSFLICILRESTIVLSQITVLGSLIGSILHKVLLIPNVISLSDWSVCLLYEFDSQMTSQFAYVFVTVALVSYS